MPTGSEDIVSIFLIAALIMGTLVIFIILFVLYYQRRMIDQKLKVQELEFAYERDLLKSAIESQEKERRRIAADLHDDIGASLSAIKLRLNQFERKFSDQEAAREHTRNTKEMVTATIKSVRSISHGLTPMILEQLGLEAALGDQLRNLKEEAGIKIHFECQLSPERLPAKQELALFRVTQELISNTLRHAEATEISIFIASGGPTCTLEYRDNGKGFDPVENRKGLGRKSMESRIRLFQGTFAENSSPGEGMQVLIELPTLLAV